MRKTCSGPPAAAARLKTLSVPWTNSALAPLTVVVADAALSAGLGSDSGPETVAVLTRTPGPWDAFTVTSIVTVVLPPAASAPSAQVTTGPAGAQIGDGGFDD